MSDKLTLEEFPPVSTAEWDAAILKDLKGAAPKTRLYYRAEDLHGLEYLDSAPGQFPYTRGTRGHTTTNGSIRGLSATTPQTRAPRSTQARTRLVWCSATRISTMFWMTCCPTDAPSTLKRASVRVGGCWQCWPRR